MSDETERTSQVLTMCATVVALAILWTIFYNYNILPQRMAEKHYCWQVVRLDMNQNSVFDYVPCGTTPRAER